MTRERMLSMGFDSDEQLDESREDETSTRVQFLAAVPLMAAMTAEVRKRFTIEFRHHFQVPNEARTIKDRITKQRHKAFIDVFERELAGVTP